MAHSQDTTPELTHTLDRTLVIRARPETVFRYFTDDRRWATWWGAGSAIDARPGGRMLIRYPNGVEASGEVLEVAPPDRIVFTYGYASGEPIGPGASRVTIALVPHPDGTQLTLTHAFADAAVRDPHVQGWRYQLSVFANIVSDEVMTIAAERADAWFAAWANPDAAAREATFSAVARPDVEFRDRYSSVSGLSELLPHVTAAQRFMPGILLTRQGDVRVCQGLALVDWVATAGTEPRGTGTNVFGFDADGRIANVTGFWGG
jgi:uncharacterized protein YndB with AHSA1/START domain